MNNAEECQLNEAPFYQCCCKCKFHLQVMHHCTTAAEKIHKNIGCCCNIQKGWACVNPEFGVVYDNWPEHSCGCEYFTRIADEN